MKFPKEEFNEMKDFNSVFHITTEAAINLSTVVSESITDDNLDAKDSPEYKYKLSVSIIIAVVIIFTSFGNLITIVAVRVDRHLRSVSYLYIASLASADLIVGSTVMTFMLMYTVIFDGTWALGPLLCDIWTFIDYVACTASLTNVCVIAADRYQTVSQPLKAIRMRTKRRALIMITCAWLLPASFWLLVIVYLRISNGRPEHDKCHLIWEPPLMALLAASLMAYTPILIILTLFVAIILVLKKNMAKMESSIKRSQSLRTRKKTRRCQHKGFTSSDAGGISFNPRYPAAGGANEENNTMTPLHRRRRSQMSDYSDTETDDECEQYFSVAIQLEKERLGRPFYRQGRFYRSVSTSTSPERYGLVKTVGINTSPVNHTTTDIKKNLPDVAKTTPSPSNSVLRGDKEQKLDTGHLDTDAENTYPENKPKNRATRVSFSEAEADDTKTMDSDTNSSSLGTSLGSPSEVNSEQAGESDSDLDLLPHRKKHYASRMRAERYNHMERSRLKQQLSAAKTLGIIMTFLLMCWLPFAIMWPLRVFCPACITQSMYDVSIWINYINSTLNPIIYCLCNPNFKRAFRRILTRRGNITC